MLPKLKKETTPIHVLCGFITVLAGVFISPWLLPLCLICFLIIQVWTEKEWKTSQYDFWEYVLGIFSCCFILLVLEVIVACYR